MALTKAQIIDSVQQQIGLPRNNCTDTIEILLEIIKKTLENGDDVLISGFGKFCVNNKEQRKGRNPATGEDMMLSKRRVVTFKCSSVLRDRVVGEKEG